VKLNFSKLQNKVKISEFWKEIFKDLNAPLVFTSTLSFFKQSKQNLSATPCLSIFNLYHSQNQPHSYAAMWHLSTTFKFVRPELDEWHDPCGDL